MAEKNRVVWAVVLGLAACNTGGPQPTVEGLAHRLAETSVGCIGFEQETDALGLEPGALEQGVCRSKLRNESLTILTYSTNEARDVTRRHIDQLGGGARAFGDRWEVRTITEGTAQQVADVLGGEVA